MENRRKLRAHFFFLEPSTLWIGDIAHAQIIGLGIFVLKKEMSAVGKIENFSSQYHT